MSKKLLLCIESKRKMQFFLSFSQKSKIFDSSLVRGSLLRPYGARGQKARIFYRLAKSQF